MMAEVANAGLSPRIWQCVGGQRSRVRRLRLTRVPSTEAGKVYLVRGGAVVCPSGLC